MRLLPINSFFLVYLMLLQLGKSNEVYGQLLTMSDQVAKEDDDEVVIPCNYSQVTSTTPNTIQWNEVDEVGVTITTGIVNDLKMIDGRYSLRTTLGKGDLVIAEPVRNDSQRRFRCQIRKPNGDYVSSDPPSILTVYYLDEPVLSASKSNVYEGASVTLLCSKPDGDPVPNISWYKDGQALNTTGTTRFDTSEDALEVHIKATTPIDSGMYTCKAESDQFQGEYGKTSNQIDLKVGLIYLTVTFESEAGIATCTADGHPTPSSVMIYKDGKMIKQGEVTATLMINKEICESNIICYAENGECNVTKSLETCDTDLSVTFESEAGIATCTAEGHPKPSSVIIYIDWKMIEKGEVTATLMINEEICQSNIICSAENEQFNVTKSLETCNTDESVSALLVALIVIIAIVMLLWVVLLLYFIYSKNIEMAGEDVTAAEGDPSLVMSINYRPSIARFESFQWDKNEEEKGNLKWKTQVIGSSPKLFSSSTFFFKYILHCCFYFCGICCYEYYDSYDRVEMGKNNKKSRGKAYEELEIQEIDCEREPGDGQDIDCSASQDKPSAEVPEPSEENETDYGEQSQLLTKNDQTLKESTLSAVTDKGLDPREGGQASSCETRQITYADLDLSASIVTSHVICTDVSTPYAEIHHGRKPDGGPSGKKKKQQGMLSTEEILYADLDLNESTSSKIISTEEQTPYAEINWEKLGHKGPSGKKKQQGMLSKEEMLYADLDLNKSTSSKIIRTEEQTLYAEINQGKLVHKEEASCQVKRNEHTEIHDSNTRDHCSVTTNGRGTISLKISKPVRSDEGEYKCSIVRGRQQYQLVKKVHVCCTPSGLSDKNLKKLAVQIKDWYALGIQLDLEDEFLDKLVKEKSFAHMDRCIVMLQKWRDTSKLVMADQVQILIRTLQGMNDEENAIKYLSGLLPEHSMFVQSADFTKQDADSNPTLHGCSNITSISGQGNQAVSVSDQAKVENIAINPVAKTIVQMSTQQLTEEEKEKRLKQFVKENGEELLKTLQQELKKLYQRENFTQFTQTQWSTPYKIDIQDLFTDMIMFQNPKSGNEKHAKEISINDIATAYEKRKDGEPKRILIQGELGNGKTTLMKRLAHSWADDPNKGVFAEKMVLFLELKNMQKKSFLENAIENGLPRGILKRLSITLKVLQLLIVKNAKNFVFLCDGYDELSAGTGSELVEVFEGKELNESVLVVTTRPDNMDKLVKVCESHIKIRGFKPEWQDEYIRRFFIKEKSVDGQILIKLRDDRKYNHIFEMARTPLFLFYLCTLWKVKRQVPSTVIELYQELLVCKVNQFLGKQEEKCSSPTVRKIKSFSEISPEHLYAMLYVGKVTLNSLFENRLSIKQNELTDEKQTLVASKLGLVFEETSVSELHHIKCFIRTHHSESEFLASLFVAETMKEKPGSDIDQTVRRMLSTPALTQVCKFTVALLGDAAHLFMDYFPLEDFKSSGLADLLDECPESEVKIVKDSIKRRMNEVKYVTIKSPSGLNIVKELNNFKNAVTCTLDTTSEKIGGSDIPNVLYSMNALTSLTWDGVIDEILENFPMSESMTLSSGFGMLAKISLQGKLTKANSCRNLGSFLYNFKAMESLELPVISYGPGLYTFVSAMYGHCCSGDNPSCNSAPQSFNRMTTLTFILKRTFSKGQRNSGYAHLVSRIMALCPSLKMVDTKETNEEFEFHLFRKLAQLETFRDRQKPEVRAQSGDLECHASITLPTIDYKNCVSILFRKSKSMRMISRSTSEILSLSIAAHQVNSKLEFKNCRLMSMPVQLLSKYLDTDVSESVHLTWYQDFLSEKRNFEEIKLISQLMAKHKKLVSLSLPCEALSIEQLPSGKGWMVKHIEFTCNDIDPKQDKCKEYMTQINGYISNISSIETMTLPPFQDAVSHLKVLLTTGFPPEFINKLLFSGSQKLYDVLTFDPLVRLMGQLPKSWFNQMDVDREGTISFSVPTKCAYEDEGSKYTVTRVKDGLQRKLNCTMISFSFGLRGLAPCHIHQLANKLREERLHVDRFFIFPGLMFSNPHALQIISGLEEVKEIKMVSFNSEAGTNNYLNELHMVKKNTLKVFDLHREQLMSYVKTTSGNAPMARQSYPLPMFGNGTSHVKLNQVDNKKVTDLSKILQKHPNLLRLRIVDYFDSSGAVDNMVRSCDQQNIKHKSLKSLTFENKILLKCSQAVNVLRCFPNLQKLDLSCLQNVQPFLEAVLNATILTREALTELNLGDCNLKFPNSGTLIAKFLLSFKNLQVFKITPIDSKMSASIFMELVCHIDTQGDNIHKHLRVLSFGEFKFDGVDAVKVGETCGRLLFQFPELQSLDMSMFRTGKSCLPSFFTTLNEHHKDQTVCCGLRNLDLSGHNFKSKEMKLFCETLKILPNLSELRLEMCRIRANPGNFLDRISHLSKIDLSLCHFKEADHKKRFVAQVLRFATVGTKLRLVGSKESFLNSLGKELESTGIKSSLGYLDLSNSKLCNVHLIKDFLVTSLSLLKTLVLKNCGLNATVLGELMTAIKNNKCSFASELTTLDMSSSRFHEPGSGYHLVSVMEMFPELLILRLSNCHITKSVMEQLLMELKRRGSLALNLRSLVLLDNDIKSPDIIALQVARYLPLDCKVKVSNPKRNVDVSVVVDDDDDDGDGGHDIYFLNDDDNDDNDDYDNIDFDDENDHKYFDDDDDDDDIDFDDHDDYNIYFDNHDDYSGSFSMV